MLRRIGIALLVLLASGVSRAQEAPENLLPASTHIYLRWDGIDAHRAAYEKTALGQMMHGDMGKFVDGVFGQLQESIGGMLTNEQLLGGVPPERLKKLQEDAAEAPKLLALLAQHGLIVGVEVRSLEPASVQATLILPGAGAKPGPLFGTLRLLTTLAKEEVKEKKIAGRTVFHLDADVVHLAWWVEGPHVVLSFGTDKPEATVKRMQAKGSRLVDSLLYKKVLGFKQFETGARAYIDATALVKIARSRGEAVGKLIDDLGLGGLHSVTFYSGFDGAAERSVMELDMPSPRKGLLRLAGGKPFTFADAPPVPPDVTSWSMTNFDAGVFYDTALLAAENIVRLVSPDDASKVKDFVKLADASLGISLRDDLLAMLGDKVVSYSSPGEGPLTLGQSFLISVKDGDKVLEALDGIIKSLAKATGADLTVKKKKYHGVELREVHWRQPGMFLAPSYAVHKGWLSIGYFPQAVQGYILRANGELPGWKPDEATRATVAKLPNPVVSISFSDPRPTIKTMLSLAPLAAAAISSAFPDLKFEASMLPNAQEATQHLFWNVSVVSDDGKTMRMETRASLDLPLELTGIESYVLFYGFAVASFRGF